MVRSNEVRIGSWLKWKDNGQEFDCVAGLFIRPEFWNHLRLGDIEPIPLTPEILIACGFKNKSNFYRKYFNESNCIEWNEVTNTIAVYYKKNTVVVFPVLYKSLHQLQNLYFALTGEELTYAPLTQTIPSGSNTVQNTEETK